MGVDAVTPDPASLAGLGAVEARARACRAARCRRPTTPGRCSNGWTRSSHRCRPGRIWTARISWRRHEAADEAHAAGEADGPLFGLPVGVKDIIDTADLPTEDGTVLHAGRTPREDAAVVRRLRAAGGLVMGKTVTTELATYAPGQTRNPHHRGAHAGRLFQRLGGCGGGGHGAAGHRHADQRVGHPAGFVLRGVRFQAQHGPDPAHRHPDAVAATGRGGCLRTHSGRRGPAGRGAGRP